MLLVNRGAAVDIADSSGRTALSYCAEFGSLSTCELLLDRDTAVDSTASNSYMSLSYYAELGGQDPRSRYGLARGGKLVDLADFKGRTPLSYAAERGNFAISKHLLNRGAKTDAPDFHGQTPLQYICTQGR